MNNNINQMVQSQTCTGCATCFSFCPCECIDIIENRQGTFQPVVDESKCKNCGVCVKVCGNNSLIDKDHIPNSAAEFIGDIERCYTGFSNWDEIRINSSSGGLITQLSIYCLENKIVDGVIGVDKKPEDPSRFEARIYQTPAQAQSSSKSKYIPVPLNRVLKEIMNEEEAKKYLFIGLPCHLKGLNKAENSFPVLREKIILKFGLFCSHTPTTQGTDFLIQRCKVAKKEIQSISFRDQGWNSAFSARDKAGKIVKYSDYWGKYFSLNFFTSKYCFFCNDLFGRGCDLSFGDAWLEEYKEDKKGVSLIISRTPAGENLLKEVSQANQISLNALGVEKIIQSQKENYYFKSYLLAQRVNKLRKTKSITGKRCWQASVYNAIMILHASLTEHPYFIFLLRNLPDLILQGYIKVIRRLLRLLKGKIEKIILEDKDGHLDCNNRQKRSEKHQPDLKGGF